MVSATIDHMISITVFLAALLLFINMFSQTNQTAIIYQQHREIATKCSDLIDDILLNPGSPSNGDKEFLPQTVLDYRTLNSHSIRLVLFR